MPKKFVTKTTCARNKVKQVKIESLNEAMPKYFLVRIQELTVTITIPVIKFIIFYLILNSFYNPPYLTIFPINNKVL